jgi:hypothetical protein
MTPLCHHCLVKNLCKTRSALAWFISKPDNVKLSSRAAIVDPIFVLHRGQADPSGLYAVNSSAMLSSVSVSPQSISTMLPENTLSLFHDGPTPERSYVHSDSHPNQFSFSNT